jgi:hypothetical protein
MQSSVLFLLPFALLAIAAPVQLQPEQDARDVYAPLELFLSAMC